MSNDRAIKLAIESMNREIQSVAVDANLHDVYGMDNPTGRNASKKRADLREAIKALENIQVPLPEPRP